ncbi:hypothetical protein [Breznakiella homolactica]|uniref:Uncharacterized protein n=1 Tax=Breznakiella homolactica TaxID=2798577 RepID=A0A7T8BBS3_9SPIR|nr:hypothetical protein [Breznakiella homolactica]QQO10370.1 hypothetical protein JFL75_05480 [Breznakiella homolactica]
MVLISIKNLEKEIEKESITIKQFVIYCFIAFGTLVSLVKTSKFPVNIQAYNIAYILSFFPGLIGILRYILCYKVVKHRNIHSFLYVVIPIHAVLIIKYNLFLTLPLVIINVNMIRYLQLDFIYWNVINSQIITNIYTIVFSIHFLYEIKKLVQKDSLSYGRFIKNKNRK